MPVLGLEPPTTEQPALVRLTALDWKHATLPPPESDSTLIKNFLMKICLSREGKAWAAEQVPYGTVLFLIYC